MTPQAPMSGWEEAEPYSAALSDRASRRPASPPLSDTATPLPRQTPHLSLSDIRYWQRFTALTAVTWRPRLIRLAPSSRRVCSPTKRSPCHYHRLQGTRVSTGWHRPKIFRLHHRSLQCRPLSSSHPRLSSRQRSSMTSMTCPMSLMATEPTGRPQSSYTSTMVTSTTGDSTRLCRWPLRHSTTRRR